MRSRLALPQLDSLTQAQRTIYESVLDTRGNVSGPFLAWLHSPGLADPAEKMGAFCRYRTGLSVMEVEQLILLVAAHHRCTGEQQIHEPIAIQAGLSSEQVELIRQGALPLLEEPRLVLLAALVRQLLLANRINDEPFATPWPKDAGRSRRRHRPLLVRGPHAQGL